jgi:FkbM family methyltransferase
MPERFLKPTDLAAVAMPALGDCREVPPRGGEVNAVNRRRIALTIACRDAADIPKVEGAGRVFDAGSYRFQLMHNGVRVIEDCYYGAWMTELITALGGHHEPQEERSFHQLLPRLRRDATMIELGSFWGYYSLWFKSVRPAGRAILLEPDPNNLATGRRNFAINGLGGEFIQASIGAVSVASQPFACESDGVTRAVDRISIDDLLAEKAIERVDLLLCDTQGAELAMLEGSRRAIAEGRLRFAVISTHHHSMSGDPLSHQSCRAFAEQYGTILVEHSVPESYSGDGLIVVSFDPGDRNLPKIALSYNRARNSLFGELEYDLAAAQAKLLETKVPPGHPTTAGSIEPDPDGRSTARAGADANAGSNRDASRSNNPVNRGPLNPEVRVTRWWSRFSARFSGFQETTEVRFDPVGSFRLALHQHELISDYIRQHGVWEQEETALLIRLACAGQVLYDIGANLGWHTVVLGRRVAPNGAVYSFEPDRANFALLRRNCELNRIRNAKLYNCAVSDTDGHTTLFRHPSNFGDHRIGGGDEHAPSETVPTWSLRTLIERDRLRPPDLMKIDTQGSEARVLASLPFILSIAPQVTILLEFWPHGLGSTHSSVERLLDILRPMSLSLLAGTELRSVDIGDLRRMAADANHEWHVNILAARN